MFHSAMRPVALGAAQDLLQWIRRDHLDGVALEVVTQLPGCDEEREEKLLLHGVPLTHIPQHRADKVHGVLDKARRGSGNSLLFEGLASGLVGGLLRGALGRHRDGLSKLRSGLGRRGCG